MAIPLPKRGAQIFDETFTSLNDILNKARQASLERGKFEEMQRHNGADIGLRREAGARAGALQPLRMDLLKAQIKKAKTGNKSFTEELDELNNWASQNGQGSNEQNTEETQTGIKQEPNSIGIGQGMMANAGNEPEEEEEEEEQSGPMIPVEAHEKIKGIMDSPKFQKMAQDPMMRGMMGGLMKKRFGFNPFTANTMKEPPEVKRANDLKKEKDLLDYKHAQKIADEKHERDLKNDETKQKTIESAKKDLPLLEESLHSLNVMKKIASDKNNDDMFGHWVIGNRLAGLWSDNPNVGIWQAEGVQPIVDTEMKLSSRGNIPALKFAIDNKPNFAESRLVALSKINSNIEKIMRSFRRNAETAGQRLILDPKGELHITTIENAAHLPKGWKIG